VAEFGIAQYLGQDSGTEDFAGMDWNYSGSAIGVIEEHVATSLSCLHEPSLNQSIDGLLSCRPGQACHTATF